MNLLKRDWREEKVLAWAFGGLWVFVTAFLWAPSRDGIEGVYALAFFIPMLLLLPWRKPEFHRYGGWFSLAALAYAAWSCVTTGWGGAAGFFILQWLILATWLFGSAWLLQKKSLDWDKVLQWFLLIGAVTAMVCIAVFYWRHPLVARLEGITLARAPTLVGQVYGVVVLIGILLSWRSACFKSALGLSLATIPALAAVVLSQSRGPLLSLALVLAIGLIWLRPPQKILLTQLCAALLALFVAMYFFPLDQALFGRGASFRDQIWWDVIAQMCAQPQLFLLGVGMNSSTDIVTSIGVYHHAHNAWLDIFYRTGIVGVGLAVTHLVLLMWSARKHRHLAPLTLWLVYGCGCLFVDSRSLFWEIDAKWLLYWIPAALLAAQLSRGSNAVVAPSKIK